MKVVSRRLHPRATKVAMASTATSLRNSSLEGKKLFGGSIREFSEELEEEEGGLSLRFGRFFGVEDILVSFVKCCWLVAEFTSREKWKEMKPKCEKK